MANSKATWNDVSKKVEYISQSPSVVKRAGETVYTTTTTSSSRSASPSRLSREVVYDDDAEFTEVSRSSVVSPSSIDMEQPMRSSRSVVKNTIVQSNRSRSNSPVRSRSSSPVRKIIKEIHHYDEGPGTVREVKQVVKSNAGSATKRVSEVHNYEAAKAPVVEKIREVHHYVDAPAAAAVKTKRVSEVHQYAKAAAKPVVAQKVVKEVKEVRAVAAPVRSTVGLREVVREIHHYDQTPRATNNVQSTIKEVKETRAASPPAKAQIAREVHRETNIVRDNNHYNDANAGHHQTTKVVRKVSNGGNLRNTNVNTSSNTHTTVVNEKVDLNRGSSIRNVSSNNVYRDVSPARSSGCCGKSSRGSSNSSHYSSSTVNNRSTNRIDDYSSNNKHVSQYNNSSYSSTGSAFARRPCLVACMGLLGLLLLGGLIAGLYFGIKAAIDKNNSSSAVNQYNQGYGNSGYYINGVYVIPITLSDSRVYLIYGEDVPCNKYNNNTDSTDATPDCEDLTTSISVADWTTTVNPNPAVNVNPFPYSDGCRPSVTYGLIAAAPLLYYLNAFCFQPLT